MLTWCCERVQVWWKVEDPYVGTIEWKASIMKRTRQQRFFGLQRQRALADPELAAMQTEALSNTVRRPTLFHSIDSFPRCFQEVSVSSFADQDLSLCCAEGAAAVGEACASSADPIRPRIRAGARRALRQAPAQHGVRGRLAAPVRKNLPDQHLRMFRAAQKASA